MKKLTIFIVLPGLARKPVGGFRVAYEYANRFAQAGHEVHLFHDVPQLGRGARFARLLNLLPGRLIYRQTKWFNLDRRVHVSIGTPGLWKIRRHRPDTYLLTSWQTAAGVGTTYPAEEVVHLVYDYEFWHRGNARLRREICVALSIPGVRYVATSAAVEEMLREFGTVPAATIHAGMDPDVYFPDTTVRRAAGNVGILLRTAPHKGTLDAISTLDRLRGMGVSIHALGTGSARAPSWVERVSTPDDQAMRRFYSRLDVFVCLSHVEAWGLPALEAMACGAAVVLADNVGCRDFARDGENCILVPTNRSDLASEAVARLLGDPAFKSQVVAGGAVTAAMFDWSRSAEQLADVLSASRNCLRTAPAEPIENHGVQQQ